MADLPRIFARPELPEVGLPRTHPDAYGAQLFHTLAEVGAAMREKQKPIDAAKHASEYDVAMDDLKNEIQADPDPNNWREIFTTKEAAIREKMLEGISDPATKEAFTFHVQRSLGRHIIDVSDRGIKASHAKQLGDMEIVGETLAQQAARTSDEGQRSTYINTYNAMITGAATPTTIAGRAVPSALTPKEAQQKKEKFLDTVEKNRAYYMIEANPEGLVKSLDAGAFSMLTGPEREAIKNHAEASIDRRQRMAKQAEVERVDLLNTQLLNSNVAGQLKIGDVLAIPDDRLPFASKRFWVDRLTQQAKHEGKDKEVNPFEKSDAATRANILAGVLTRPGEWSTEKILSYMGRGLSVTHAQQLVNMHKELTKRGAGSEVAKKYDPLNSTLSTLDGLRKSYAFTREGLDQKVTDANAAADLRMKNDAEYQKVVDQVIQRAQMGEDPRTAMQQLMQPYFDQKTKGWFESIRNWFTTPLATPEKPPPTAAPRLPNVATAEIVQTPSGPIRLDKSLSPQEREQIIKGMGGTVPSTPARPTPGRRPTLDEQAREFLKRHNEPVDAYSLEATKQYLKNKAEY